MISMAFILHHLCNSELWSRQPLAPSEQWVSKVSETFTLQRDKNEKRINPKRFIVVRKEDHLL